MIVIGLAASKGGVGKSTMCAALAVQAVKEGHSVALVDVEPQQSLSLWWQLRGEPDNPNLDNGQGRETLIETIERLQLDGYDYAFIDTPPFDMDLIGHAIEASDFVVVPVRTSIFDLGATRATVALCNENDKPFVFLLNAVDARATKVVSTTTKALKRMGNVLPQVVKQRTAYASALTHGKTAPEHSDSRQAKEARAEVQAVWKGIKAALTKGGIK